MVVVGPPDLVIGGCGDGPQLSARDGAAQSGVEVWGASFLGFDGAEVLHVPPDTAAGVLPKPVHQGREVNGIASGPPIVIAIRGDRGPGAIGAPIGIQRGGAGGRRGRPSW